MNKMQKHETFINLDLLNKLLINNGKGRRSAEEQSSKPPRFINNFEVTL